MLTCYGIYRGDTCYADSEQDHSKTAYQAWYERERDVKIGNEMKTIPILESAVMLSSESAETEKETERIYGRRLMLILNLILKSDMT